MTAFAHHRRSAAAILRAVAGFCLAVALLWGLGAILCSSDSHPVFDAQLNAWVPQAGVARQWRDEGWATTRYGAHGLLRDTEAQLGAKPPLIFLHGDSFVEALQVPDDEKPEAQLTRCLRGAGGEPLSGALVVGLGESGLSAAGICFRLPRYEQLLGVPQLHIVMFTSLRRLLPDANEPLHAVFTRQPELRMYELPPECPSASRRRLAAAVHHLRGYVLWQVRRKLAAAQGEKLRFGLGPVPPEPSAPERAADIDLVEARRAFDFVIARLQASTRAPILIVHNPQVPVPVDGRISETDSQQGLADALAAAAQAHGVAFLSTRPVLLEVYRGQRRFPYGFPNTKLGVGHLNASGIRAVAAYVADYLHRTGI